MRRFLITVVTLFAGLLGWIAIGLGQDAERSAFIQFVEEQISSPSYQIRLNGLEGTLSSDVTLESITIADEDGIWLTVKSPRMVWTRSALLRGRLEINALTADSIDWSRLPGEDESLPSPESNTLELPQLPVAVNLEALNVGEVVLGEGVAGLAARLRVQASLMLEEGILDLDLDARRLDGPGGNLRMLADYREDGQQLALDVALEEPRGGLVASALGLTDNPPVRLAISGNAPLEDLTVSLDFDVNGEAVLDGRLAFDRRDNALFAEMDLAGPLSNILGERERQFFGENLELDASLRFPDAGGFNVLSAKLDSGMLGIEGSAATTPDGFLRALELDLQLLSRLGQPVQLPVDGEPVTLESANLEIRYDGQDTRGWQAQGMVENLSSGSLNFQRANLEGMGQVEGIEDPQNRTVDFDLDLNLSGLSSADKSISQALGETITFQANGDWQTGKAINLPFLRFTGSNFDVFSRGRFSNWTYDGETVLRADDMAAFSALADRPLGGALRLTSRGTINPLSGAFDLNLDGRANDLSLGDSSINGLLKGQTSIQGGAARGPQGLSFERLEILNQQARLTLNGQLASQTADLVLDGRIYDLAILAPGSSGRLQLSAEVRGENKPFDLAARVGIDEGTLAGREAGDLAALFTGTTDGQAIRGQLSSTGTLAGEALQLAGTLIASGERQSLSQFQASLGGTRLSGDLKREESGLLGADLEIDGRDISAISALALANASGQVNGNLTLSPKEGGQQNASMDISIRDLRYNDIRIGNGDLEARVKDLFGGPQVDARIDAETIQTGGLEIAILKGDVESEGTVSTFNLASTLSTQNTQLNTTGRFTASDMGGDLLLERLDLNSDITDARLREPGRLQIANGELIIENLALLVGDGTVSVTGNTGERLDLSVNAERIPLAIANSFAPNLGAAGTVTGQVELAGTPSNPSAKFTASGAGISVRQLASAGIAPLNISANGNFAGNRVQLAAAGAANGQGLDLNAAGTIPLSGSGLSLSVQGTAPLAIAQPYVRDRGASVSGTARINVTVSGSLAAPLVSGPITVEGASYVDPLANVALENIALNAELQNSSTATLSGSANLRGGGQVRINGSIGLANGLRADLTVLLDDVRYTDNETFDTRASGTLQLSGPLTGQPLLSGTIDLAETEITVPESFAANDALLDVKHQRPGRDTRMTLERIRQVTPKTDASGGAGGLDLDLMIRAPNRIFVRGRGLDAELGGQVRLTGPVSNFSPVGAFELIRGRLNIIGRRINLDEGRITLAGDFDPLLDFIASVETDDDVRAIIRLEGRASDLAVTFSSEPALPEDEVLARIIFGRSLSDLSPAQIVRLASIAGELTGGNAPSLVDGIREQTGLDDVEIVTDDGGGAAVRAGRYINDNIYLGVEAGENGGEATVNLDINENIKLRGSVGSGGESEIGVFFERDY